MLTLRAYHLLELAVNVVQNGWTLDDAYDHITHFESPVTSLADCAAAHVPPSALATRAMLEDIYREVVRQNLKAASLGRREGA